MAAQYVDEFLKELRRDGDAAFLARYAQPVLVVTRAVTEGKPSDSVETTLLPDTSGWRMPQPSLVDRVFILSRGAFAKAGPLTLGRTDSSDVTIDDKSVSKRHCVFEPTPEGMRITDLGSTNGTSVNGVVLTPNEPRLLRAGDMIDLGNFVIEFHTVDTFARFLLGRPPR
ncbi:MAG: domain containing protein [Myxococcales bacterium]|nr:domain containing protein [Myxococcales bacterium]